MILILAAVTALLPQLFPHARAINVLLGGNRFLVTWGVVLVVAGLGYLVRRHLRAQYPGSPNVPRHEYSAIVISLVLLIGMAFVDEYYRVNAIPDTPLIRYYLVFFGYRRFLLTWPILAILIFVLNRYLHQKSRRSTQ